MLYTFFVVLYNKLDPLLQHNKRYAFEWRANNQLHILLC